MLENIKIENFRGIDLLENIKIENFRGIDLLEINDLKLINIFTGDSNLNRLKVLEYINISKDSNRIKSLINNEEIHDTILKFIQEVFQPDIMILNLRFEYNIYLQNIQIKKGNQILPIDRNYLFDKGVYKAIDVLTSIINNRNSFVILNNVDCDIPRSLFTKYFAFIIDLSKRFNCQLFIDTDTKIEYYKSLTNLSNLSNIVNYYKLKVQDNKVSCIRWLEPLSQYLLDEEVNGLFISAYLDMKKNIEDTTN